MPKRTSGSVSTAQPRPSRRGYYSSGEVPGPEVCCVPRCETQAEVDGRVPLCLRHQLEVWRDVNDRVREEAPFMTPSSFYDPEKKYRRWLGFERTAGEVYFIRFGDRVKIGFSTQVRLRLANLPHDEVLAVIPGSLADEKRCHAAWKHLRVTGEWFIAAPDLLDWVAAIAASNGAGLDVQQMSVVES